MKEELKTGTTTVGIVCKEGLVLAADKRATAGNLIVDKRAKKIHEVTDRIALTMAGTVSDVLLLIKLLKAELKLKKIRTSREPNVKESANLLSNMVYNNIRKFSAIPGISHFIVGGVDMSGFHLYDLFPDGSLTEINEYISSGSGSVFVYGVMESQYKKGLSIDEGIKLAVVAINAALQRDNASGNGVDVMIINKDGCKRVLEKELNTKIEA
ncbi:proteasome subunit beta [Candidatus Woesearchaeota archaeon]|nr:proteasome subunit beta [Candidatus Woesearchaeota archaeon]MBW3021614.1 proteasome subunit beta [Candidatus Woesearchaeota archaeon]